MTLCLRHVTCEASNLRHPKKKKKSLPHIDIIPQQHIQNTAMPPPPPTTTTPALSPAELSFLHASLALHPPLRPDGRAPTQSRPLVAETGLLPHVYGSARVALDGDGGGECVVGVRADVVEQKDGDGVEVALEVPGCRDDDPAVAALSAAVTEVLAGMSLRLELGTRSRWRLVVDVLLLGPPLAYPLPLLSTALHLALRSTRLPALAPGHTPADDPLFDDDWEAARPLCEGSDGHDGPDGADGADGADAPITLLAIAVADSVLFDPSPAELAVADAVVALALAPAECGCRLLALRTIDPPSRRTPAGVLRGVAGADPAAAPTTPATPASPAAPDPAAARERDQGRSVWRPPRGGVSRAVLARMIAEATREGGVGAGVLGALRGVES